MDNNPASDHQRFSSRVMRAFYVGVMTIGLLTFARICEAQNLTADLNVLNAPAPCPCDPCSFIPDTPRPNATRTTENGLLSHGENKHAHVGVSGNPVYLFDGTAYEVAIDLQIPVLYGQWALVRSYRSSLQASSSGGKGWQVNQLDMKVEKHVDDLILLVNSASRRDFISNGDGTYTPPKDSRLILTADTDEEEYRIEDTQSRDTWAFHDHTTAAHLQGRLKYTTRNGAESANYAYYDSGEHMGQVSTITFPKSSHIVSFSYQTIAAANGISVITNVSVKEGGTNEVMKAEYKYKDDIEAADRDVGGTPDSLVQVTVFHISTVGGQWTERTTQYRYRCYANEDGDEGTNCTDQSVWVLKSVFEPDAVYRAMQGEYKDAEGVDIVIDEPADLFKLSDAQVGWFANREFEYYDPDGENTSVNVETIWEPGGEDLHRYAADAMDAEENDTTVKREIVRNEGCCGGASGITRQYHYVALPQVDDREETNEVVQLIIEDTEDANGIPYSRRIYGINRGGRVLREVLIDDPRVGQPSKYWCQSWTLDARVPEAHLVAEERTPTAHDVSDDADLAKFLDPFDPTDGSGMAWANDEETLHDSQGLTTVHAYDANSNRTETKVKNGRTETAYFVAAWDYVGVSDPFKQHLVTMSYDFPTQTTSKAEGVSTRYTHQFWSSDLVAEIETELPAITDNGSGIPTKTNVYYDSLGNLRWTKDGEGYVTYYSYHPNNNQLAYLVEDADPNSLPSSANSNPDKWITSSANGADQLGVTRGAGLPPALQLTSTREYDGQGRVTYRGEPGTTSTGDNEHYTVYEKNRVLHFPYWDSSLEESLMPIEVVQTDDGGRVTEEYSIAPNEAEVNDDGEPTGLTEPASSSYVSWTKYKYALDDNGGPDEGRLSRVLRYHDSVSVEYYTTTFDYDSMGRRDTSTEDDTNQVIHQIFDKFDRVIEVQRGLEGSSLATAARMQYDDDDVGNGHLTRRLIYLHHQDQTDNMGQMFHYTYRGHLRGVDSIYDYRYNNQTMLYEWSYASPHTAYDLDWNGRRTYIGTYSSPPNWSSLADDYASYAEAIDTNRLSLNGNSYDELGRRYRSAEYFEGTSKRTEVNHYYDRRNLVVATQQAYSAGTEYAYDGAGRRYQSRTTADLKTPKYASGAFQYQSPQPLPELRNMSGGNEKVIELTHDTLDGAGNSIESHTLEVNHTDIDGIDISATDSYVSSTTHRWFDKANRPTHAGYYGSSDLSGGSGSWVYERLWNRDLTPPTVSDFRVLLTKYSYADDSGLLETVTDPAGQNTMTIYDDLGRETEVTSNYVQGGTESDENQVVKIDYDGPNRVEKLVAMEEQETTYAYEDDYNASLVTKETFGGPNSDDVIEKKYYFDGSLQSREDARGVQIGYAYNDGTRLLEDELLLKLPAGVDGAIQSIKREYDDRRRLTHVRSFDAEAAITNDVEFVYHDFDRLQYFRQSHEGATTESSPQVEYDYQTGVVSGVYRHALRHMRTDYPSGKRIYTSYNSDDSYDDRLHRVHQKWGNLFGSDKTLLEYKYNGTRRVAEAKYPAPDIDSPLYTSSPIDFDTLDRFGRVKSKLWKATATLDQVDYTHDLASNRRTRDVGAAPDLNQTYDYDGLHRLTSMMELGGLNQNWPNLDSWGNWRSFNQSGGGATPISQTRNHNDVNEIDDIDLSSDHVAHDDAGNMTRVPKPADWNAHYDLVYDAWNRLVKVNNAGSSIDYEYDGLHRRIVKKVGADTYDYYYNVGYQVLEVRKNGSTNPLEQYAWHPYYIDALAMRYYDADTDGSGDEQYATHDANFNVTALIDVNGTAIERYHYMPYGDLAVLDANYVPTNNPSSVDNPYAFTGRRLDSETGLHYFRNRYYHSQLGRFITRDPILYKGSAWNLYEYVRDSPVGYLDPLGLKHKPHDPSIGPPRLIVPNSQTPIPRKPNPNPNGPRLVFWKDHPWWNEAYNCHSKSIHGGKGDPTDPANTNRPPKWDDRPDDDLMWYDPLDLDEPNEQGDLVIYGTDTDGDGSLDKIDHSGLVAHVDGGGNILYIESKEGEGSLTIHHPDHQNPLYGSDISIYRPRPPGSPPRIIVVGPQIPYGPQPYRPRP